MSSPERMEMHARAIANLVQAMDRMEAEQQVQNGRLQTLEERYQAVEARARAHEEWMQAHEEWIREHAARVQAHEEWMQAQQDWAQGAQADSRENRARIREIITELTSMQADIARLDAAS